jgi:endonuclease YncB( thermonuclease family)
MIALYALALITGTVTSVTDGDTFRLGDGTRIRLQGIDANEKNGSCHNACAPMSGVAAKAHLSRLALGKQVRCDTTGKSYKRITAWCRVGSVDLSCAQMRAGAAVRWPRYDPAGRLLACRRKL